MISIIASLFSCTVAASSHTVELWFLHCIERWTVSDFLEFVGECLRACVRKTLLSSG